MKPLPVYSLMDVELVRGQGSTVWDSDGREYLDLYGGHAVISIGHAHPRYVDAVQQQVARLGFYSNSVRIGVQERLAERLGTVSGYTDYRFFMVNSGAEANENAIKLASFVTGRSRVIAFDKAFHGRTSLAVATTDNPKIVAPVNRTTNVGFVTLNDIDGVRTELAAGDVAAVIVEGIQGVAGIRMPDDQFLRDLAVACEQAGTMLILDEVQSGIGRTGRFFAHQWAGIRPPIITVAKGLGNGFPVGGVLVHPGIDVWDGMLGTTFGGNHLACAAALAVLDVVVDEKLMERAHDTGAHLRDALLSMDGIVDVRGRGLMLGFDTSRPSSVVRAQFVRDHAMLTGNASTPTTVRLLPALTLPHTDADRFLDACATVCSVEVPS